MSAPAPQTPADAPLEQGLSVEYFDGRSSRAHTACLRDVSGRLFIELTNGQHIPLDASRVRWSPPVRHGMRSADLPDGARVQGRDPVAWDAWLATHVRPLARTHGWVARWEQSWRGVMLALMLLLITGTGLYVWGLPVAARGITELVPLSVDQMLGEHVLQQLDAHAFTPSRLDETTQQRLRQRFAQLMRAGWPQGLEQVHLEFRASRIGPNAVALPGGTVILTDELVQLVRSDDVVMGVLGHEVGHVIHRHGMNQLVRVSTVQFALSVAMGDYASVLTTVPLVLMAQGYARDHERQADTESVRMMRASGISPSVMVRFFELLAEGPPSTTQGNTPQQAPASPKARLGMGIWSSHPDDAERMAFFRSAAQAR